jgi:hypothetical protein
MCCIVIDSMPRIHGAYALILLYNVLCSLYNGLQHVADSAQQFPLLLQLSG